MEDGGGPERFSKIASGREPQSPDFEPDGTWYSMVAVRGVLYAVEPNHGELDAISPFGEIRRVADISATQGHIVPTAVAYHGNFFVGNLNTFPIQDGSSKILKVSTSGRVKTVVTGVTTVLGVAFDCEGYMYILENTGNPFPTPYTGKVLRVTDDGLEEIATGLFLPTAMIFGPEGALYVSNVGFGPPGLETQNLVLRRGGDDAVPKTMGMVRIRSWSHPRSQSGHSCNSQMPTS